MTYDDYNAFCASLSATTYVMQWGCSHVWKVGGKVFAIGGFDKKEAAITFKTSPLSFEILKEQHGLRPAPYLAARGFKWIQNYADCGLNDEELRAYIAQSYSLVAQTLSKKRQRELGLKP